MSSIEDRYNTGLPIFNKLFEMNSKELKAKLAEICTAKVPDQLFDEFASVKKVSSNDVPERIEVWAYDHLSITPFGIDFTPEHSYARSIVEFNKFFTL